MSDQLWLYLAAACLLGALWQVVGWAAWEARHQVRRRWRA